MKSKIITVFILVSFLCHYSGCAIVYPKTVDYSQSLILTPYSEKELVSLDRDRLREYAEAIACCAMNKKGTKSGDPLNIILVADLKEVIETFKLAGWDQTEELSFQTGLHMFQAFLRRTSYRHSPVSKLYFEEKKHDLAFQKIQTTMNYRLHLRLWRTPLQMETTPVWIGQISRDVGVKFVRRWNFLTHRIDARVDDARDNLLKDLDKIRKVKERLYVEGVGESTAANPRYNLHKDPYYTDGRRLVLVLGSNESGDHVPNEK